MTRCEIHRFTFNPFGVNTYLLYSSEGEALIIDPGCSTPQEEAVLRDFIQMRKLQPTRLLLTHAHIDHVLGNAWVAREYGLQPQMHRLDLPDLERLVAYAPLFGVEAEASPPPSLFLAGGERLTWSGPTLELLEAPGHSPGSLCFYIPDQEILVSGDVLFERSIGRTDLPGGHHPTLLRSIRNVLWALPDSTVVHPGHGESTQIGIEKRENPFLREG